uniref:Uncharacterized protein n=1 Tax=Arundo donax TaxID=35708 RepID=A0A0A9AMU4_ARUDO
MCNCWTSLAMIHMLLLQLSPFCDHYIRRLLSICKELN